MILCIKKIGLLLLDMENCKFFLFGVIFFFFLNVYSQNEINDNLRLKSFDELFQIYNNEGDFLKRKALISIWIFKAKKEDNISRLMTGYHIAALLYPKKKEKLFYSDSIISLSTGNEKYNFNLGSAYVLKGEYYYKIRDFIKALDYYVKAKKLANNKFLKYNIDAKIGIIKNRVGKNKEALEIQKRSYHFAKKHIKKVNISTYLNSVYSLSNTFNSLNLLDSAYYYNELGRKESLKNKLFRQYNLFLLNQGTTSYLDNYYLKAIDSLKKGGKYFKKGNDYPNLSESYYYLGNSYAKINAIDSAIFYYKKIDTLFIKNKDLLPIARGSYEFLINYYKNKGEPRNQLTYLNQLMKLDSILYANEISINKKIVYEYDIPKMVNEKNAIILKLERNKEFIKKGLMILSFIALVLLLGFVYQNIKRKQYKERFNNVLNDNVFNKSEPQLNEKKSVNVSNEIVERILLSLESFENNHKYIDSDITLQNLSKSLNTNTNYLSKVINQYKESSFTNYINNLRVECAIRELKTNPIFLKYTIKAISSEVGFKTSESFSKAFFLKVGIKPSYFVKELEKINSLDL